jgi:hypothetical protein
MLEAMVAMPPAPVFLKSKLFAEEVTSPTDQVALDYYLGSQKLAPFIARHKKGSNVPRERFKTQYFSPPFIKPVRPLTADDLFYRSMGESAYSQVAPAAREADLLAFDMQDLNMRISRTEEWMVSQCLFTGSITALDGDDNLPVATIDYGPISETVVANQWDVANSDPLQDLKAAIRAVSAASGFQANLIVMGKDAGDAFESNAAVKDAYSRFYLHPGVLEPRYAEEMDNFGVVILGTWRQLPLYVSESVYEAADGTVHYYVPANKVLVAATGLQNKIAYAAVAQSNDDQTGLWAFEGTRIPQVYYEAGSDTRWFRMSSRPVPCPTNLASWTVCDVCTLKSTAYKMPQP